MEDNLKRQIILNNYQNPSNKKNPNDNNYLKINTNNESCIDNIDIYLKIEKNKIKDIKFEGEACVIAISSTEILSQLLKEKTKEEALEIINNYHNMIENKKYNKDLLKQAIAFDDISKQPSRKICAKMASDGIEKILKDHISN